MMSDETAIESSETSASEDDKALLRRRIYVMTRLDVLKGELQALREERAALTAQIREMPGGDVRLLVRRRTYVSVHHDVLTEEQKRLMAERKNLSRKE